jgi:hypothetical protein
MDQANPITESSDASTLSRLETFLAAEETPVEEDEEQVQDEKADAPESSATDEDGEPNDKEEVIEYQIADLAKLLGAEESMLDIDPDGQILVKTKIDGEEGKVKFSDVVKSYQLQGHVDKQAREIAEQRKSVEKQAETLQKQIQVQQKLFDRVAELKMLQTELARFDAIDWNAAFDTHPAEASKASHQRQALQASYEAKLREAQAEEQAYLQAEEASKQASDIEDKKALLAKVPAWADPQAFGRSVQEIVNDLKERKSSEKTLKAIDGNHELFLLARDAMLYRKSQAEKPAAEKAVRATPKIIRSGTSQSNNRAVDSVKKLHANVKNSGSRESVMQYLLATGKV